MSRESRERLATDVLGRTINEDARNPAIRENAVTLLRDWHRFEVVSDPEVADLIFEVLKYHHYRFGSANDPESVALLLVWPKRANPKTDDVIWLEKYETNWRDSDSIAGVLKAFRDRLESLERENAKNGK